MNSKEYLDKKKRLETLRLRYTDLMRLLVKILDDEDITDEMRKEIEAALAHQRDGLYTKVKDDFDLHI